MDNVLKYNISGKLKKIAKEMAKNYTVKIGLLAEHGGAEQIGDNLDLAGLGALQEFGADIKITPKMAAYLHFKAEELGLPPKENKGDGYVHIPARSWLYEPIVNGSILKKIKDYIKDIEFFEEFAQKQDYEKLAKIIAEVCLLEIQKTFDDNDWPANSKLTIAGKNSAMPLVDKGNLRRSITYEIENNV